MTFSGTEMMGIIDLRSLGFYKIKQEVVHKHLGRHYHFELAGNVCDQYNRFVNLMRKEEEGSEGTLKNSCNLWNSTLVVVED